MRHARDPRDNGLLMEPGFADHVLSRIIFLQEMAHIKIESAKVMFYYCIAW